MLNLFVNENDVVSVEIFAFPSDGEVSFVTKAEEVGIDVVPDHLKFTFRKPNYDDSRFIMSKAAKFSELGSASVDASIFQDLTFRRLLKEWNVRNEKGEPVEISDASIGKLNPELVRLVVTELLGKIKI